MSSKVGTLIKEARTAAGLTQEKLAKKVGGGLTAADISKVERGEMELPGAVLKKIAVATGVTQASLLNAAKGTSSATVSKEKDKTPASAGITMRVTATEQRLVKLYRQADTNTKKAAMSVLKGEQTGLLGTLLGGATGSSSTSSSLGDTLSDVVGDLLGNLTQK